LRHKERGRRKGGEGRRERVFIFKEDNEGGDRSSSVKSWKAARSLTQSLEEEEEEEEEELCAIT